MPRAKKAKSGKSVEALRHEDASRTNIPTAEYQSMVRQEEESPIRVAYERRNRDLDPQLVWRGKDEQDKSDLVVNAPPLYIQEKVHPKALIDDLMRQSKNGREPGVRQLNLFADFNGLPEGADRTEFYRHDANWSNRMILGDSLQVMASLSEREGLQGKVQCIYIDPPYGIRFNSNFQWSTTSRDVRDGSREHITREPEQVKAFRDTWRDGIHSYLTYLRDRLTVARDLLTDSGSIFVQIGDENVHRVRALMDEVFGEDNFVSLVDFAKTSGFAETGLPSVTDYLLWYCRNKSAVKVRQLLLSRSMKTIAEQYRFVENEDGTVSRLNSAQILGREDIPEGKRFMAADLTGQGETTSSFRIEFQGRVFLPTSGRHWSTNPAGIERLRFQNRLYQVGDQGRLAWKRYESDYPYVRLTNQWIDTSQGGMALDKIYVVQTITGVIQRCILMSTDPGDLVLDPTCGSGTTAYVAEQWGRRWITIDTSRVALALARARIMGARYPYYLLADSREGQLKEAEVSRRAPSETPTYGKVRQGFVCERVPHITLRDIANNAEIDVIWETAQEEMDPLREELNRAVGTTWEEWEIPRKVDESWSEEAVSLHAKWWERRIARQREIDASIAAPRRLRVPVRQALREPEQSPSRRSLHSREHIAPPGSGRGRERRRYGRRCRG